MFCRFLSSMVLLCLLLHLCSMVCLILLLACFAIVFFCFFSKQLYCLLAALSKKFSNFPTVSCSPRRLSCATSGRSPGHTSTFRSCSLRWSTSLLAPEFSWWDATQCTANKLNRHVDLHVLGVSKIFLKGSKFSHVRTLACQQTLATLFFRKTCSATIFIVTLTFTFPVPL